MQRRLKASANNIRRARDPQRRKTVKFGCACLCYYRGEREPAEKLYILSHSKMYFFEFIGTFSLGTEKKNFQGLFNVNTAFGLGWL